MLDTPTMQHSLRCQSSTQLLDPTQRYCLQHQHSSTQHQATLVISHRIGLKQPGYSIAELATLDGTYPNDFVSICATNVYVTTIVKVSNVTELAPLHEDSDVNLVASKHTYHWLSFLYYSCYDRCYEIFFYMILPTTHLRPQSVDRNTFLKIFVIPA